MIGGSSQLNRQVTKSLICFLCMGYVYMLLRDLCHVAYHKLIFDVCQTIIYLDRLRSLERLIGFR